ncbi:MAG: hypothetical protein WCC63_08070 [Candidatus Bathyarchaeia archaeon]
MSDKLTLKTVKFISNMYPSTGADLSGIEHAPVIATKRVLGSGRNSFQFAVVHTDHVSLRILGCCNNGSLTRKVQT